MYIIILQYLKGRTYLFQILEIVFNLSLPLSFFIYKEATSDIKPAEAEG